MKDIHSIFAIPEKEKRYNKLVEWVFKELLGNKGSILEQNDFSEQRKVRNNGKKLVASMIFSKDPESSAHRGPSMTFRIYERQQDCKWVIDLFFKGMIKPPELQIERDLDFETFINPARAEIIRAFIHD